MARYRSGAKAADDELPPVPLTRQSLLEAARLARYLQPYWLPFAGALVALGVSSLSGLAFPYVTGNLIDRALAARAPGGLQPGQPGVDAVAAALIVVLAVQAAFSYLHSYWFAVVGERSLADLRRDTYGRLLRLPMAFHTRHRVGELASRLSADLGLIQGALTAFVPQLLRQVVLLVGGVVLIALTSGRLALVMLGSVPALVLIAAVFGRFIRRTARQAQDRLADTQVVVEETLQGIASVKAFANEEYEESRYRTGLDQYLRAVLRGAKFRGAFVSFIVFALFGGIVLVLWYGARLVQAGDLSAGELTRFMLYTLFVGGALGSFAEFYSQIQRTLGASHRIRELLREVPEDTSAAATHQPALRLRGDVAFEDMTFRYPSRPEIEVLRGVSLAVRAGQRVALVGPSGAGKSTLVNLLLRFYEPDRGRLLIDSRDARDYALHDLRSHTAVVPQDVLLFGGTIADNIAYGKPGASEAEIVAAARQANAHEFIVAFPEGYQTRVGERGVQLSGGQRQRVAIARAVLRDPAILILDEATSSLDSASESLVLQALDRLMQGRTSFVIAHRLSTVRDADCIFVLQDGAVVESGTHAELVARVDGVYRNLTELQLLGNGRASPDQDGGDAWLRSSREDTSRGPA
jgi:ATP-binding cassette subfamily B protein